MLIIPIKDGENIDRALKTLQRKFDKTGTVRQLRARTAFIKPSKPMNQEKHGLYPKYEK
jgi:small subunit ribosomal protein S21